MKCFTILQIILAICVIHHGESANETNPIFDRRPGPAENDPQSRVINGNNAAQGRYPYMASLHLFNGFQYCGGTLIAPDVVLSASHCSNPDSYVDVGRWNLLNNNDDFERRLNVREILHPNYDDFTLENDIMLIQLDRPTTKPVVALNSDLSVPLEGVSEGLRVMGFGYTVPGSNPATILQEADVNYVPNDDCEKSRNGLNSYQGRISEDMMCAADVDEGQDSCQGDSGGPLIVSGGIADRDVQVGVVSWGFGCALRFFPGVYSRVSHNIDWVRANVCAISVDPPEEFDCDNVNDPVVVAEPVPVVLSLNLDDFPTQTGWEIVKLPSRTVVASAAPGTYQVARAEVRQEIILPGGQIFEFEINDTGGNGLCCASPGSYSLNLGTADGEALAFGQGTFGFSRVHEFTLPARLESDNLVIGEGQVALTVQIQMDSDPRDIGWSLERLGLEVEEVIRVIPGAYTTPFQNVVKTVAVEENELYSFVVFDIFQSGIQNGYVRLFLGTDDTSREDLMIFSSDGNFGSLLENTFKASSGSSTEPPIESNTFLTLELRMDTYPEEIGFQLRVAELDASTAISKDRSAREDRVIFFRPPRFYVGKPDQAIDEVIPILDPKPGVIMRYTLIITDSFGDGLCCGWVGQIESGYTLYKGAKEDNEVLHESRFVEQSREIFSFDISDSDGGGGGDDDTPVGPSVNVRVTIKLDRYPSETGFRIENSKGRTVFEVRPGTYNNREETVQEDVSLVVGLYTFTIIDAYGDGMTASATYYDVSVIGADRPPLIHSDGVFTSEESTVFVLEGDSAQYPVWVEFTTDSNPTDIGYSVTRLDLVEAEAHVALIPPGFFDESGLKVKSMIPVQIGGLYRVTFIDLGGDGIGSPILLWHGGPSQSNSNEAFSIGGSAGGFQRAPVRFFAGTPASYPSSGAKLDFRVLFDRFPSEVEWILLGEAGLVGSTVTTSAVAADKEIIAFSSPPYSQQLASTTYVESIPLPPFEGTKTFTFIVSDTALDGVCCSFGSGGPIELFNGDVSAGNLIFSDPFDDQGTSRVVRSFSVVGIPLSTPAPTQSPTPDSASSRTRGYGVVLASITVLLMYSTL